MISPEKTCRYQRLLDHCLKWYVEHSPEKYAKAVYQDARDGHWRLTIDEKKRILTAHIFGVDIDAQAVEVTKIGAVARRPRAVDQTSPCRCHITVQLADWAYPSR
jgi:hypothetical protein